MSKILDSVTLTDDFVDNEAEFVNDRNLSSLVLYVDYTKGTETLFELKVEYSTKNDVDGAENWIQQSVVDLSSPAAAAISNVVYTLAATGKHRFEVPIIPSDDKARISVKGTGTVSGSVTVEVQG